MVSNSKLFTVYSFDFRLHHLLIIGILTLSFSISALIRSQAGDYGFELTEFDPFFNYRATEFLVENGLDEYLEWHDDMSWYPWGRNISATSQVMLHVTAAFLYQIFGFGTSLYDFTVILPVIFASLTVVIVFALVRVMGGTTAGLFASLFFALSLPLIIRGTIGWFKSEPVGLFYSLLALYLFLSGLKSDNHKVAFAKLVAAGVFMTFGLSAWGGNQFFVIPIGLFIVALPFLRKDHNFLIWAVPLFIVTIFTTLLAFERPGIDFIVGFGGFGLFGPTIFLVILTIIRKFSKNEKTWIRNGLGFLGISIIGTIALLASNVLTLPTFRYLNAINPFLTTEDILTTSVAEHLTLTVAQTFTTAPVLLLFAGLGVWFIFRRSSDNQKGKLPVHIKNEMTVFALIIGLVGVYASSAFARLELFSSIGIIILSSVGLAILTSEMLGNGLIKDKKVLKPPRALNKISYVVVIIILLLLPTVFPVDANLIDFVKAPPTILNGGSNYDFASDDWFVALDWIKNNTPEDAIIASWWDYGYWITTIGERTSLADNSTLFTERIEQLAKMFVSNETEAWKILQDLEADYVLVYVVGQRITDVGEEPLYFLGGGGEESKMFWIIRISGENTLQYLHDDYYPNDYFWENTLAGKMIPFTPVFYLDQISELETSVFLPGFEPVYVKDIKYFSTGNGPLKLAYESPSINRNDAGIISGVLIYEVNHDYELSIEKTDFKSSGETAVLTTIFGDIEIAFKDDVAPRTVANFKELTESGFFDGTLFHRIVPGFVIQGGDPNTITGSRDTWGTGDPGYTIAQEFSNLQHKKYIVSMARGPDINSAGSQFFIMLDDAPWLDGQYTIFGEVISGQDVVDKIASLETNALDQPIDSEASIVTKVMIKNS